jgi:hypothetical protein
MKIGVGVIGGLVLLRAGDCVALKIDHSLLADVVEKIKKSVRSTLLSQSKSPTSAAHSDPTSP